MRYLLITAINLRMLFINFRYHFFNPVKYYLMKNTNARPGKLLSRDELKKIAGGSTHAAIFPCLIDQANWCALVCSWSGRTCNFVTCTCK